ncbi:MAG: hypothetical protein GY861_05780 [bacterium]|nr:hypothetical protein [bacterium]
MQIDLSKREIEIVLEWQLATLPLERPDSSVPEEEKVLAKKLEEAWNKGND